MELYLIRHAHAADRGIDGDDDSRPLTAEGERELARVVAALERQGVELDQLLHSPLLRAVQTAELVAPLVRGETQVCAELAREPDDELLRQCTGLRVALVGHEPWLGELAAWLLTGDRALGHAFAFRKAGVMRLDGEARPRGMTLGWSLDPHTLAKRKRGGSND